MFYHTSLPVNDLMYEDVVSLLLDTTYFFVDKFWKFMRNSEAGIYNFISVTIMDRPTVMFAFETKILPVADHGQRAGAQGFKCL